MKVPQHAIIVTQRWGSKNFGAFLDALHGDPVAQERLAGGMLLLLQQKSPRSLKDLAEALAVTELQLYEVVQRAMSEGRVDTYTAGLEQHVRLVEDLPLQRD
jgi:hypothetical protein